MKKANLKLALHGSEFKEVTGYRFDLTPPGFGAPVPVLVHRPIGITGRWWTVSDFTTGWNMASCTSTVNMALSAAENNLARCGEISYNWMVEQVMRNRDRHTPMPPVVRDDG